MTATTTPSVDRLAERYQNMLNGDPSEALPKADPPKGDAPKSTPQRKVTPPKHTATPDKILPRTNQGAKMSTTTAKKSTAKKSTATRPATAKKSTAKKATATKRAPSTVDVRALPFVIAWTSSADDFKGHSNGGDWGNARYRIKNYLIETKALTGTKLDDALAKALDAVREGKSVKVGTVSITCTKR